ncbi:ragulator complex protein LAMTOR4 homolog [Anthonomus grandis grandis]|uniref:ragulator complex protein LAMTOR4 homolog n=1 Tax=Anthonomus grandis grandis TaxID=2921223 RepID=UPI0021664D6E|nr:ragulator complex protein LAMTOR4 homolog [Anthonomus grandis grandis]XP_050300831.1 ragulator complex protein LAMTOR4 homolog [Anthonomus grandis grandis]XP_050300832.1 ragulator complex protein LAMTOR4 homolog [Anthonomus grandis grandis]
MDLYNVPGVTGYLTLNADGAVLASGGDLDNDERTANILYGLLGSANDRLDPAAFDQGFKRLSVTYDDHAYVVCLSNRKIHIVKRQIDLSE